MEAAERLTVDLGRKSRSWVCEESSRNGEDSEWASTLGDKGNDRNRSGVHTHELRGGAGADTFYARDGYQDRVFGGTGCDRARVDRLLDRVRSIARFF
jgi:hypothetical protein